MKILNGQRSPGGRHSQRVCQVYIDFSSFPQEQPWAHKPRASSCHHDDTPRMKNEAGTAACGRPKHDLHSDSLGQPHTVADVARPPPQPCLSGVPDVPVRRGRRHPPCRADRGVPGGRLLVPGYSWFDVLGKMGGREWTRVSSLVARIFPLSPFPQSWVTSWRAGAPACQVLGRPCQGRAVASTSFFLPYPP